MDIRDTVLIIISLSGGGTDSQSPKQGFFPDPHWGLNPSRRVTSLQTTEPQRGPSLARTPSHSVIPPKLNTLEKSLARIAVLGTPQETRDCMQFSYAIVIYLNHWNYITTAT
jgi:hypothetical protein